MRHQMTTATTTSSLEAEAEAEEAEVVEAVEAEVVEAEVVEEVEAEEVEAEEAVVVRPRALQCRRLSSPWSIPRRMSIYCCQVPLLSPQRLMRLNRARIFCKPSPTLATNAAVRFARVGAAAEPTVNATANAMASKPAHVYPPPYRPPRHLPILDPLPALQPRYP